MNLPNYFLADLPPEAGLSPQLIADACATLKRNRGQHLAGRNTAQIVGLIAEVAAGWLQPENPFRKRALEHGPAQLGFSRETLARGLDGFFNQLTAENLYSLIEQDLGDARRLDAVAGSGTGSAAIACGPELIAHIAAGNIPNPTLMSVVLGLLVRSAQFVKCASGATLLPRLFAHSIYDADHKLGSCLEVCEWRGGDEARERALFAEADCVTITGDDDTLTSVRNRLPVRTKFIGHGHRVSFGYIAVELLNPAHSRKIIARAAEDVTAWDQLGCLSPHVIYVQSGGAVSPVQFAAQLADELARRETIEPRGALPQQTASRIVGLRGIYEMRAANSSDTHLWQSEGSTAWTVVCESDAGFDLSCLHRFIYVKPVRDAAEVLRCADAVRGQVSTVGIAAPEHRAAEIAASFARWGVTRVCALGQMQKPPLIWRHDGRPALGELVTWTDFES